MRIAWLVSFVCAASCGAANAPAPAPPPPAHAAWTLGADFAALRPRYMAALDGASGPIEAELAPLVAQAIAADDAHQLATVDDRAGVGLVLVYEALLLVSDVPVSDDGNVPDPGPARRHRAVALLQRAKRLRPDDGRIASWLAGAQGTDARDVNRELPVAAKQRLIAAIDVAPTFNLWTAFIALRNEPVDSETGVALFAAARAFVASGKCRDVAPGSADAHNCTSGPLAPYNTQAARVMLADVYARNGEHALRAGDLANARPWLGTARGILATLTDDAHRDATAAWREQPGLTYRLARLDQLQGGPLPRESEFWFSDAYESAYACAACHVK